MICLLRSAKFNLDKMQNDVRWSFFRDKTSDHASVFLQSRQNLVPSFVAKERKSTRKGMLNKKGKVWAATFLVFTSTVPSGDTAARPRTESGGLINHLRSHPLSVLQEKVNYDEEVFPTY